MSIWKDLFPWAFREKTPKYTVETTKETAYQFSWRAFDPDGKQIGHSDPWPYGTETDRSDAKHAGEAFVRDYQVKNGERPQKTQGVKRHVV